MDKETIKTFPIFDHLSEDQLDKVVGKLEMEKYKEGEAIFEEGDMGNSLYLLLEGEVEISQALTLNLHNSGTDKREKSLIRLDANGKTFFGEVGLIEREGDRTATVRAISDCTMAKFEREDFDQLAEEDPTFGYQLLKNISSVLCQRLRTTNTNVLKISTAFSLALERRQLK